MTVSTMPKIGDVIASKYRLGKVAGEGGMGIVYAAEHLVLKQQVAVKVLLPHAVSSEAAVERFAREARAAAKIDSEHVARVLDAGVLAGGTPFLVMEFLEGCDLEELLALEKTLSITQVADVLIEALEGLAHAHAANIIHRDLKPANLFLACRPDGTNEIKLLDFGISKTPRARPEDKRLTGQHVLGSPVYMSPEQLRNATDIDTRADIWSIGVVAYELLTGLPPFDGEGVGEIFANILEKVPLPLSTRSSEIPEELSQIIAKCLRRDPSERWRNAAELARALLPWASEGHAADVERAEQVLARAKNLMVQKTPLETRRVVEAIEAAALRANSTRPSNAEALPLARKKTVGTVTLEDTLKVRAFAFAKRSPLRMAAIAAFVSIALGGAVFGVTRATRASTTPPGAAGAAAMTLAKLDAPPPPPPTPPPPPAVVASASVPRPPQRAAKPAAGGKAARPKFLNTRE